jgi:CRP/FNR family transcriptional regulator
MAAAQEQMILLATKTAEERVCTFLLLTARRDPALFQKSEVNLPMTRQDIGDYLGLTIETVSRTFSNLACRDAIVATGRHCYRMRVERLSALAGEIDACHSEAHMHYENKGRRAAGF